MVLSREITGYPTDSLYVNITSNSIFNFKSDMFIHKDK